MLKSSEYKQLWSYSNSGSSNFKECSKDRIADPPIQFYFSILRIGALIISQKVDLALF